MINKKGAMFGLDARIALAIFGALSVISGAALYSAIQESKITQLHTNLLEIGKAWEQYMLDVGEDIPINADSYRHSSLLVDDTKPGWKGPYLSYEKTAVPHDYVLEYPNGGPIYLFTLNDNTWSVWNSGGVCTAGQTCYMWVAPNVGAGGLDLAKQLDIKLDGSDTPNTGNVRIGGNVIYLKYAPVKNPN